MRGIQVSTCSRKSTQCALPRPEFRQSLSDAVQAEQAQADRQTSTQSGPIAEIVNLAARIDELKALPEYSSRIVKPSCLTCEDSH
jgi:hypothetical protein